MLHLAIARDDVLHLVRALRIGHRVLQLLQLGRYLGYGAGTVHHLGHRTAATHLADVLAEVADGDTAIDGHLTLVRLLLTRDHAEQRRLAGSIRTDEADLLAPLQRRRGFDEEEVVAVL